MPTLDKQTILLGQGLHRLNVLGSAPLANPTKEPNQNCSL